MFFWLCYTTCIRLVHFINEAAREELDTIKCVWSEQRPPDSKDCFNVKGGDSALWWQPVAQIVFVRALIWLLHFMCFHTKLWSELSDDFISSLPRWLQIREWHQQRAPLETDVLYSNGVGGYVRLCVGVHAHASSKCVFNDRDVFRKSRCICHFSKLSAPQLKWSDLNQCG